jgi:CRISPR-associated endonuclease Csn1
LSQNASSTCKQRWRDNYFIGLDIGTHSVGWAVCDDEYHIPRIKGKRAWGVRLFEKANPAAARRGFRSARRRAAREKLRIKYLRRIFAPLIDPIDPGFFKRMDDAFFMSPDKLFEHADSADGKLCALIEVPDDAHSNDVILYDKQLDAQPSKHALAQTNTLFNDPDYTDKDYHDDFPTIWHLRKYLIELTQDCADDSDAMLETLALDTSRDYLDTDKKCVASGANNANKRVDARHYYLAILHMLKNRGHFLYSGEFSIGNSFAEVWQRFEGLAEQHGFLFIEDAQDKMKELVASTDTLNDRKRKAKELLATDRMTTIAEEQEAASAWDDATGAGDKPELSASKRAETLLNMILGSKTDLAKLFALDEKTDLEFKKGLEEQQDKLDKLSDEELALVEAAKQIYDFGKLENILNGETMLSSAVVNLYETHKEHLALLKRVVPDAGGNRHFYHDEWVDGDKDITYVAYARGARSKDGKKHIRVSQEDFVKTCRELAQKAEPSPEQEELLDLLSETKHAQFMPLQKGFFQGIVPNQLHGSELKLVLQALINSYPCFASQNTCFANDPTSVLDTKKITSMLAVRYPYWAGPLGEVAGQKTAETQEAINERQRPWFVKLPGEENSKVYPWNFSAVINQADTATKFIKRMTGKCSYLYDQPVLPKCSPMYQKYMVLNDINSIKLNGRRIGDDPNSIALKQSIFTQLFCKRPKVSVKDIRAFIKNETGELYTVAIADADDDAGRKINSSMSTYYDLAEIFGANFAEDATNQSKLESAVLSITSLPDSPELVLQSMMALFADDLAAAKVTEEQLQQLSKKQYAGWGKLSKMLLEEINAINKDTGELKADVTILSQMWKTNKNFNELVKSTGSQFIPAIDAHNRNIATSDPTQMVLDSWASPPVKRSILQAYKIETSLFA